MQKELFLDLGERSYTIQWNPSFDALGEWVKENRKDGKNGLVTNTLIHDLYKDRIEKLFPGFDIFIIEDGESLKSFATIENLCNRLLEAGFTRSSTLWAFGGGVIGDITGFLASAYMRGISYYQIPTTLLSMVDSSVGGKTGVNLTHGKNMAGAFYQPRGVFINITFLKTLDAREIQCGLAEIIKSALIYDPGFFDYIKKNTEKILDLDEKTYSELSFRSVRVKAAVVAEDEKEKGLRAILNFGHTLAHALESFYQYTGIKHGEAVLAGMHFAALLSGKLAGLEDTQQDEIINVLDQLKLPHTYNSLPGQKKPKSQELVRLMKGDKKNIDAKIRFVLLKSIGQSEITPIADNLILETLEEYRKS